MYVTVSDIPSEGLEKELELLIVLKDGSPGSRVRGRIRLLKFGTRVLVEGDAEMTASLSCSRCLKEYTVPLKVSFSEEYIPEVQDSSGGEREISGNELNVGYYKDDKIYIEDIIKEQMLLVLPIKQLCKDDCKGLCSKCGQDKNAGSCECKHEHVDPRLAKLSELKERLNKKKE